MANKKNTLERFPGWLTWSVFLLWGFVIFKSYLGIYSPDIGLNVLLTILSPAQYLSGSLLTTAIGHAANLSITLGFLLAAAGFGRFLLIRLLPPGPLNFWEEISFSAALGLGIVAQLIIALTAIGYLFKAPVLAILLVGIGLGALSFRKGHAVGEAPPPAFKPDVPDRIAFILLIAAMLFALGTACAPEVFYDPLVYHLAVPNF